MPENELVIELLNSFPSIIKHDGIDLGAALRIMDELGIEDKLDVLFKLEFIKAQIPQQGAK